MNFLDCSAPMRFVSAGCHINDVMNIISILEALDEVSAGCHINDVMNY